MDRLKERTVSVRGKDLTRANFRRLVDGLDSLPSVPLVAQKVGEMVHNPRNDARAIANVMKGDPALSAKVLKIVNSPYYGIPGGVSDVTRAISFLGFSTIHELVLTVSVFEAFKDARGESSHALFRHSLAVAGAAEAVAQIIGHATPAECFTAGLLHDLGRLAMLQIDPAISAEPRAEDELHEFVGDRLAARWRFPLGLRAAIAHHHEVDVGRRGKVAKHLHSIIDVIALADVICKRQGYGVIDEEPPPLPKDVLDRLNLLGNIEETAHDRLRWNLERSEVLMRVLVGDA
ncbi:MAG: HDOD domain-containing protein [Myxococcota bacterium]